MRRWRAARHFASRPDSQKPCYPCSSPSYHATPPSAPFLAAARSHARRALGARRLCHLYTCHLHCYLHIIIQATAAVAGACTARSARARLEPQHGGRGGAVQALDGPRGARERPAQQRQRPERRRQAAGVRRGRVGVGRVPASRGGPVCWRVPARRVAAGRRGRLRVVARAARPGARRRVPRRRLRAARRRARKQLLARRARGRARPGLGRRRGRRGVAARKVDR